MALERPKEGYIQVLALFVFLLENFSIYLISGLKAYLLNWQLTYCTDP